MPTFPANVRIAPDDYGLELESAIVSSDMDSGPSKTRPRVSRVLVRVPMLARFATRAELDTFHAWFKTTIHYGADWFDWTDRLGGGTVRSARIQPGTFGKATRVQRSRGMGRWTQPFTLEYWSE